jgi:hypothetical protein
MNKIINAALMVIVYEASERIFDWLERKRRIRKIVENIDKEEEFTNFAEIEGVRVNLKDLDKYSDEKLMRVLELTYYFNICKGVNNIINILKKSQEKKKGEK